MTLFTIRSDNDIISSVLKNVNQLYLQLPNQEVTLDQSKVYSVNSGEQEIEFKDENEPQQNVSLNTKIS